MPPESLSMLAVIKPGPSTARKSSIRIRQRLSIGQGEEFNLNSLTVYSKAAMNHCFERKKAITWSACTTPTSRLALSTTGSACRLYLSNSSATSSW